jgi:hypothetical protein
VKSVLAGHKSLEHLSITAEFESGEEKRFVDRFPGTMSRTVSTKLNRCGSDLQVGLAYFGLTCIGRAPSACGLRSPRHWKVKCDGFWDNSISPWLVCNWLHMMPGEEQPSSKIPVLLSTELVGVASQAVNQGIVYANASNLVPHHLSTSSATVLFCLLRRNFASLPELWDKNALSQ